MLSPKTLKKLPKTVHSPKDWSYLEMKEIDSLLRCPICYDFMHTAMILPECSHTFCSFCIRQHLSHTNQCPACNHGACENNLRNNRLVDDLIVQFKAIRSLLLEITQKHSNEKDSDLNQSNETVLQESKTQKKLPNSKTITSIPTTVKDDVIDLISEDGEGKEEDESEDWKLRENKENQGISTPGKSLPDRDGGGELSTPRNQRSSLQSMFSPSPKQMVSCPVCGLSLREGAMNDHLDLCLGGEEKKSALRKPTPKRKPMAKLVYNLMSERDIKKKLKEVGLSTAGDKKTLVRRHHDFVMLYNSECDALKPKSVQEIVKEVEKTENIRNRSRTDHSRLLIEKNSSPATIEKAQKIYMKKHKSHFSDLIAETKKRMREQRMKQKKSSDGKDLGPESEAETSVTEASDTGTVGTQSESEGKGRRMSSRNRKRAGMGQCDEEEVLSGKQDIIEMSSQSETEGGTRRKSSRMKVKVIREEDMEMENSDGDGSELEVVSVQNETECERRMSVRHQGKNMSDQGKTGGSCVEYESERKMKKSRNSKGVKKEVAEIDEDSDPVSQIETDGKSRRRSVRNKSKIESSKATENESTEDTEQNNQRRTRNRNTSLSAMTKTTNEAKRQSGQERKQDRNMGNEPKENRHQNHTPKRSTQNKKSDPNSSRAKKAYTEIDTGDSSEEKVTEMEVESDFQEQDEGSAGKNEPDLLDMVDKADILSTLPGKNGHSKSKSNNNEGTFKRKKNLKRSQNIDIEEEMLDKQCGIYEEDKEVELEPSTRLKDGEVEMMKHECLMESLNGEKHISIKDQSDKSVGIVADGSGHASLQTTPKLKSKTCDEKNEAGKSENLEKDDSLHIDETPVKEYDVDISTLWPALSGAVVVSTSRTRHLSSISTKSDKSNCSDLSAVFSPIKDLKNMEGEDEKNKRLPVKREISGDFENRKRKRLSEPASRKRRRR
eukprot:XP_019926373.1 PREDICTED: dentin sialophosphoprotein-like [Crassostrea gigas]